MFSTTTWVGWGLAIGGLFFLAAWPGAIVAGTPAKIPIILDCDIGTDIDDTFAVALAALCPELELQGVTTVSGDTHARALMVCRLLSASGRLDVPVAAGAPEKPPQALRGFQVQYVRRPMPYKRMSQPIKAKAVEFIYQQLKAQPGQITLVAVGPLSNIAELLSVHPDCKPWIKRLVLMGGSVRVGYSNKPPIQAEFNIRADPKAAQVVFRSGIPLVIAPLDATTMLKLDDAMLKRIFGAGTMLNYQVQALYQLWDQKAAPVMYDPVAVTLCVTERFCTMEDLHLEVDGKGFTRIGQGKPNVRVATAIDSEHFLKWFVERFTSITENPPQSTPVNLAKLIPQSGMPNRVHVIEDYETDIEKRWWLSGKAETLNVPPGSKRANRGVLVQDFDSSMGDQKTMHTAVIFNPVPGPPMGKNPRLSFRYYVKGTDILRVQIYSLSNNYHRFLTLTGLPQGKWEAATVDMTAARRRDGSSGPLSENERIDDIQFYTDPRAELIIDDVVLYDEARPDEKRPFPKRLVFTGWFDTGKQGKEWPGTFDVVPGYFWKAAKSVVNPNLRAPWIRINLRGERTVGARAHLYFRYKLKGADTMRVALVHAGKNATHAVDVKGLHKDRWSDAVVEFSPASGQIDEQANPSGPIDEIHFRVPAGAELLIDDVLLYEP